MLIDHAAMLCLALNIHYEAGGQQEHYTEQVAIGHVTINRASREHKELCAVVFAPMQFQWTRSKGLREPTDAEMIYARGVALHALRDVDFTKGATHYHADYQRPDWAKNLIYIGKIGRQHFYRELKGRRKL